MHDIDRTQMEFESDFGGGFQSEEFEYEQGDWSGESGLPGVLSEIDEMELASELLGVETEAELEEFLGGLIKKVGSIAGKVIRSPIGKAVGGVLKTAAKKALPLAGGAIGGYFGGPLGAKIGSGLASAAGKAVGLEAESQEDLEFEGAKQFVRLAANTVAKAAAAPSTADPRAAAQAALTAAAKRHAPGLLAKGRTGSASGGMGRGQAGRWIRRGNKIVLYDI